MKKIFVLSLLAVMGIGLNAYAQGGSSTIELSLADAQNHALEHNRSENRDQSRHGTVVKSGKEAR